MTTRLDEHIHFARRPDGLMTIIKKKKKYKRAKNEEKKVALRRGCPRRACYHDRRWDTRVLLAGPGEAAGKMLIRKSFRA